tara:strand:- start:44 stop:772 length:729 start_codon:yes stop_codon:yes gene_type:complete
MNNFVKFDNSLTFHNGGIEALKWIALASMILDHVNKYLFNYSIDYFFEIGRLAMPLFGIIFAYNMARDKSKGSQYYIKVFKRLTTYGLIATPYFTILGGVKYGWWPLNILFTFAISTLLMYWLSSETSKIIKTVIFIVTFAIGGAIVEFWWPALTLIISSWAFFRYRNMLFYIGIALGFFGLCYINGNYFALLSIPLFISIASIDIRIPRMKRVFYYTYAAQFPIYFLIRIPMENNGYIFLI